MNYEQIKGVIERVLTAGLMWAAGAGYIPQDQVANIGAAALMLFTIFWGWKVNTQPALIASTASLPDVKKVVVTSEMAENVESKPDAKVTTS